MSSTINDHRCKLVTDIAFSDSPEEVKRYIDAAVRELVQHKVNGNLLSQFADKILKDLGAFDPIDYGSQQWTNIAAAMNHLLQLKPAILAAETTIGPIQPNLTV